jgi:nucleoside-diphosphate kinase
VILRHGMRRVRALVVTQNGPRRNGTGCGRALPAPAIASRAMSDRTLVLLKPDTVERKLIGAVTSRFEAKNLDIVAMELRQLDADTLARHYEEHVGKGFYGELVEFMSRGPVMAMVIEGPEDTWEVVRNMVGATNPRSADPGTIRGDLGILFTENLVHGSDSLESAQREIGIFFPNL